MVIMCTSRLSYLCDLKLVDKISHHSRNREISLKNIKLNEGGKSKTVLSNKSNDHPEYILKKSIHSTSKVQYAF